MPGALHEQLAAGGSGGAAALCSASCTVVAFSPDGTLIALASEVAKGQWTVQVRQLPATASAARGTPHKSVARNGTTARAPAKPQRTVACRCATS
jgi:hypothetical protein